MKNGIELLRDLTTGLSADTNDNRSALPQGILRFLLEYKQTPALSTEISNLQSLLQTDRFELIPLPGDKSTTADAAANGSDDKISSQETETTDESDAASVDGFGDFYVLQFPTLERTLSQRSLFDIAYALEAELGLVSAEPDLGTRVYVDPQPPAQDSEAEVEGVIKDAFAARCWVDKQAPTDKSWAIENLGIPEAWALNPTKGQGILIAQPDTGIAAHAEFNEARLRLDLGINLVDGGDDPTDPLLASMANPGHGTGTASVICSAATGMLRGAAPGAELIPIRCVEDVKIFDAAPVTAAINHARNIGAHVITMSLGGIPSRAMRKAIRRAVNDNIIVVTAAGNCVDLVVWPARYREVIAVGGSNIDNRPWKGSSQGTDVDICAPAELVWVARRKPDDQRLDFTEGAQGTSFATALCAGIAALWLSHHGRESLINVSKNANTNLQQLFRRALIATANKPDGWQTDCFGAGIINAEKLLKLQPEAILSTPLQNTPAATSVSAENTLLASLERNADVDLGELGSGNTLRRFEREIGASLLASASLGNISKPGTGTESSNNGPELSDTLKAALSASTDAINEPLRHINHRPPAARVSQSLPTSDASALARLALAPGQGLESATTRSISATRDAITPTAIQQQLDALEQRINASPLSRDSTRDSRQRLKDEVLGDTENVLNQLKKGNTLQMQDVRATTALEALVKMTGRPAIRLDEQPININDPNLQEWVGVLAMLQGELPTASQSVGRIDAEGTHQGTGFVVGPGMILTNRHVIEGFAAPIPSSVKPDRWLLERDATINFSPDADDTDREFRIHDVLFTGPDPISGDPIINHDELDLALLAVETTNRSGRQLPDSLPISNSRVKADLNRKFFLIGYPAAPSSFPKDENGLYRADVVERIRQLFGMDYGVCYLSPGLVEKPVDSFDLSNRPISFVHDATSLGGSSGSCLLSCDNDLEVMGLHYGGDWLRANFAHDLAHVSSTLIKLPELIDHIAQADNTKPDSIQVAANLSKVHSTVDLSALASTSTGPIA